MELHRIYRYVGPLEIAARVAGHPRGLAIDSRAALDAAIASLAPGARDAVTFTYVVDGLGVLRVADRSSEHVACAGGGAIFAAGELTIENGRVIMASNQSTGYCPEPDSVHALRASLERADLRANFEWIAFDFRRCAGCGLTTLVKDGELQCAGCEAALPQEWNFERSRCARKIVDLGSERWIVDAIEEATENDEDRIGFDHDCLVVTCGAAGDSEVAFALADDRWLELTGNRARKPVQVGPTSTGLVLIASDGLLKYAKMERIEAVLRSEDPLTPWRLIDLARLPSGALQDDLSAVLVRRIA